jgi:hypothetical protein
MLIESGRKRCAQPRMFQSQGAPSRSWQSERSGADDCQTGRAPALLAASSFAARQGPAAVAKINKQRPEQWLAPAR